MAEVLLFHHAQGLTPGVIAFADALRQAGHTVHTPDLFDGRCFDSIDKGLAFVREQGFVALIERGVRVAKSLPNELVYAGFSLGVLPAQRLAQTRAGARHTSENTNNKTAVGPNASGSAWSAALLCLRASL
jgi:dienelactone hydrolase